MSTEIQTKTEQAQKRVLLIDDEPEFTDLLKTFLMARRTGSWLVHTAEDYSSALSCLKKNKVDLVVLDLQIPVMDGLQFLKLLKQAHPELPVVILTGHATPENRAYCLQNGASLFLEKMAVAEGFDKIYPALESIASSSTAGFRGMLRQVEIPDVLQMECLSRKSSVLEITGAKGGGRIFIKDGSIIHAENGTIVGEPALFQLLELTGGEFHIKPYRDPGRTTIEGGWESLLMESARLRDEAAGALASDEAAAAAPAPGIEAAAAAEQEIAEEDERTFEEIVLCSATGEVLYEWQTEGVERRVRLLELLAKRSELFGRLLPLGLIDRLEIEGKKTRTVAMLQPERKVFVRIGFSRGDTEFVEPQL